MTSFSSSPYLRFSALDSLPFLRTHMLFPVRRAARRDSTGLAASLCSSVCSVIAISGRPSPPFCSDWEHLPPTPHPLLYPASFFCITRINFNILCDLIIFLCMMVYFNSLVFVFECSRFLPLEYKLHEYFVCLVYCST